MLSYAALPGVGIWGADWIGWADHRHFHRN
jgi:hypothetical protein